MQHMGVTSFNKMRIRLSEDRNRQKLFQWKKFIVKFNTDAKIND